MFKTHASTMPHSLVIASWSCKGQEGIITSYGNDSEELLARFGSCGVTSRDKNKKMGVPPCTSQLNNTAGREICVVPIFRVWFLWAHGTGLWYFLRLIRYSSQFFLSGNENVALFVYSNIFRGTKLPINTKKRQIKVPFHYI